MLIVRLNGASRVFDSIHAGTAPTARSTGHLNLIGTLKTTLKPLPLRTDDPKVKTLNSKLFNESRQKAEPTERLAAYPFNFKIEQIHQHLSALPPRKKF